MFTLAHLTIEMFIIAICIQKLCVFFQQNHQQFLFSIDWRKKSSIWNTFYGKFKCFEMDSKQKSLFLEFQYTEKFGWSFVFTLLSSDNFYFTPHWLNVSKLRLRIRNMFCVFMFFLVLTLRRWLIRLIFIIDSSIARLAIVFCFSSIFLQNKPYTCY